MRLEIERIEAKQKALDDRVDFALVDLRRRQNYHTQRGTPPRSKRFRNLVVGGFQNVADSVVGLLLLALEDGPSLWLWLAILCSAAQFIGVV